MYIFFEVVEGEVVNVYNMMISKVKINYDFITIFSYLAIYSESFSLDSIPEMIAFCSKCIRNVN